MASSKITAAPIQTLSYNCLSASVVQNAGLFVDTTQDQSVTLADGDATAFKFVGVARYAGQASANKPIEVITAGIATGIAGAAIAAGAAIESAGVAGKFKTFTSGTRCGHALTSAGADGDIFSFEIVKAI